MSSSMPGGRGYFPTAHWSEMAAAGQTAPEPQREALGRLVMKYLPALQAHLVRKGIGRQEAEEFVQDFVAAKVVEKGLIGGANRRLGRFRTYLLTALDRFVANQLRDRISSKRHPANAALVEIENCSAVSSARPTATPLETIEAAWARQVVHDALERMKRRGLDTEQEKLEELFLDRVGAR